MIIVADFRTVHPEILHDSLSPCTMLARSASGKVTRVQCYCRILCTMCLVEGIICF